MRFTIPSLITTLRILLIPFIIHAILSAQWQMAFLLFSVACITDALDGYLARFLQQESVLGACLDTLADKLLFLCVVVALVAHPGAPYQIPYWFMIFFVVREVGVMIGSALLFWLRGRVDIKPVIISKVAGFVRSLCIASALAAFVVPIPALFFWGMLYGAVILELLACMHYAIILMRGWVTRSR